MSESCVKPLAIDLFCGLASGQAEFGLCTDSAIQQLVACRAEYPDHEWLGVFHFPVGTVSSVFWSVGKLKDSCLAAGLTSFRQVREFAPQSDNNARVLKLSSRIVDPLNSRIFSVERASLFFGRLSRTVLGTVASITVRRNDLKMLAAYFAIAPSAGDIGLFVPPKTTRAGLTLERAVALVWTFSGELNAA